MKDLFLFIKYFVFLLHQFKFKLMKTRIHFLVIFFITTSTFYIKAQVFFDEIATNNIKITPISSNGYVVFPAIFPNTPVGYIVPKNKGTNTIYGSGLWLGGIDQGGQLHLAAQTYRQTGDDFTYGPYPASSSSFNWNKVWKIRKTMIDSFRNNLYTSIPPVIAQWPAHGNTALGQAAQLAPFKDLNNNGIYEPNLGEFPCIKGDEALYAIYNDDITHGETGGNKLGVEIHQMIYAFNNPNDSALWNTVFFNYKIINRSSNTYNPFYITWWADTDIGFYYDDFIGTDVNRNLIFSYNGDNYDESSGSTMGFNDYLPAAGFRFLDFPLAPSNDGIDNNKNCIVDEPGETVSLKFSMYYNNNIGSHPPTTTNPTTTIEYWNYMRSLWRDNKPLKRTSIGYDTTSTIPPYTYIYPDSSDNQRGWGSGGNCQTPITFTNSWDEVSVSNIPNDRRILGTIGPLVLPPNSEVCFSFAFIFAYDTLHPNDNIYPIRLLKKRSDDINAYFSNQQLGGCGCYIYAGINELSDWINKIYPNPADNEIHLELQKSKGIKSIVLSDISGKQVLFKNVNFLETDILLNTSTLSDGYYFIILQNSNNEKFYHPLIIKHQN